MKLKTKSSLNFLFYRFFFTKPFPCFQPFLVQLKKSTPSYPCFFLSSSSSDPFFFLSLAQPHITRRPKKEGVNPLPLSTLNVAAVAADGLPPPNHRHRLDLHPCLCCLMSDSLSVSPSRSMDFWLNLLLFFQQRKKREENRMMKRIEETKMVKRENKKRWI